MDIMDCMVNIRTQIKILLAQEQKKMIDIAPLVKKDPSNLSAQLIRGTMSYEDAQKIADYLGYDIVFVKRKPE